jgi:hypothetical protein
MFRSAVAARPLMDGERIEFTYEDAQQDSFRFRNNPRAQL